MVRQFLPRLTRIRSRRYLFISLRKSHLPLKLFTVCPQEKSSHKKKHAYLTDSEYCTCLLKMLLPVGICHRVDIYRLVKRLASSFC